VVSQSRENGYITVTGVPEPGSNELQMTFGPHNPQSGVDESANIVRKQAPRPIIWVMNEHGSTISRYDL
jgi:hypothetical protein